MKTELKPISCAWLLFACSIAGRAAEPLAGDLAGYWKFDEAGGLKASDNSENGHHGTLRGATRTTIRLYHRALGESELRQMISLPLGTPPTGVTNAEVSGRAASQRPDAGLPGVVINSWLANSFARAQGHQWVPVNVCGISRDTGWDGLLGRRGRGLRRRCLVQRRPVRHEIRL